MKHLRKFNNRDEYEAATINKPGVSLIEDLRSIVYDPIQPPIELVDLGLPSGNLWAKTNLGAETETDSGLYFAWGEVEQKEGWMEDKDSHPYDWNEYKYANGIFDKPDNRKVFIKYIPEAKESTYWNGEGSADDKLVLDSEDDPATVFLGLTYKTPTKTDIDELISETNSELVTIDGVNGYKFINKVDSSKYIFIPFWGICTEVYKNEENITGYYWSSSLYSKYPYCAQSFVLYNNTIKVGNTERRKGLLIRPVYCAV